MRTRHCGSAAHCQPAALGAARRKRLRGRTALYRGSTEWHDRRHVSGSTANADQARPLALRIRALHATISVAASGLSQSWAVRVADRLQLPVWVVSVGALGSDSFRSALGFDGWLFIALGASSWLCAPLLWAATRQATDVRWAESRGLLESRGVDWHQGNRCIASSVALGVLRRMAPAAVLLPVVAAPLGWSGPGNAAVAFGLLGYVAWVALLFGGVALACRVIARRRASALLLAAWLGLELCGQFWPSVSPVHNVARLLRASVMLAR
jgi:hypothetical protein